MLEAGIPNENKVIFLPSKLVFWELPLVHPTIAVNMASYWVEWNILGNLYVTCGMKITLSWWVWVWGNFFFPKDNILYIHDALVFVVAGKVRLTIQITSEIH